MRARWINSTNFGGRGDRESSHSKPHDFRPFVGVQLAKKNIRLAQKQLYQADISLWLRARCCMGRASATSTIYPELSAARGEIQGSVVPAVTRSVVQVYAAKTI